MSAVPPLAPVPLTPDGGHLPLLVVGPSLGTSCATLWQRCADLLGGDVEVVGWDLPGHAGTPPADGGYGIADLARAVVELADRVSADRGRPGEAFGYAGGSVGGAVGLSLVLDHPDRLGSAVLLGTGARLGSPAGWAERAATARDPDTAVCDALAGFDVTDRLGPSPVAVTAVVVAADGDDEVAPPALVRALAQATGGRLVELLGVGPLAPAEDPAAVAALVLATRPDALHTGRAERRAVLGAAHVERAAAATTPLTADFQDFITRYAWGGIWTRPALTRRERSLVTLTALVAGGHLEELALHVRAARTNGLTAAQIAECLLQTAVYCGVPAANAAFRVAQRVLAEDPA